ncbi:hypothetical protein C8J57DRAFT_1573347 [Mycena rebaudengoi]|nr:hypothetical protein C8J57DRAFT_1573347 [Mycena rebaudengoi]
MGCATAARHKCTRSACLECSAHIPTIHSGTRILSRSLPLVPSRSPLPLSPGERSPVPRERQARACSKYPTMTDGGTEFRTRRAGETRCTLQLYDEAQRGNAGVRARVSTGGCDVRCHSSYAPPALLVIHTSPPNRELPPTAGRQHTLISYTYHPYAFYKSESKRAASICIFRAFGPPVGGSDADERRRRAGTKMLGIMGTSGWG